MSGQGTGATMLRPVLRETAEMSGTRLRSISEVVETEERAPPIRRLIQLI